MKARVFVSFKPTVLDPQGQAVRSALHSLGFDHVAEVRQGKYFEIALSGGLTLEQARNQLDAMSRDVLTNPVIEDYRFELIE
jgi:phosphoribosylformylglycinamidine synthase PurS subunit